MNYTSGIAEGKKCHVCMHMTWKVFKTGIEKTKRTGLEQACDIYNCAATRKSHSSTHVKLSMEKLKRVKQMQDRCELLNRQNPTQKLQPILTLF
jgi:hypothetical protein